MNKLKIWAYALPVFLGSLCSCNNDFVKINTDTGTVLEVDPVTMLYQAESKYNTYQSMWDDSYACKLRWMQYCTGIWGYGTTNFTFFNSRIGETLYTEYNDVGSYTKHIEYLVSQLPAEEAARYQDLIEVGRIILITKGIATTDMHGSLVYSEGWGMRSGHEDLIEPHFQTQEELFDVWNKELKEAAATIKANLGGDQISLQGYDVCFDGEMEKWVKPANAVRMRIALRIYKRNPEEAKAIVKEVLASADIPASIDDSFIMYFDKLFTSGGDWHSVIDMDRASAPFMTYLKKYNDPRKRLFFQINNLTSENVAKYNAEQTDPDKYIPEDFTRWEGGTVSNDFKSTDKRYLARSLKSDGTDMRAANKPQTRLWKGMQDNGSGGSWFPILTYADFCFMASEFVLDGVNSSKTAQEWYEEGVRASITQWSKIGDYCKINDYEAVTDAELEAFMAQDGIKWNPSIAKEQIYCQSFVEHFKNNNETWAMWRRTGYPNQQSTVITFDPVFIGGIQQDVPRRTRFSYPAVGSPNHDNLVERIETMAKDPEFGLITDEFGRLWWDKK